jgi:hypothetical protein
VNIPGLPLWLAGALYVWQAIEYYKLGQPGNTLAFAGYSLANLGFIWQLNR